MTKSIDQLRRDAKALKSGFDAGDPQARARVRALRPRAGDDPLKHADFLHVIAREQGFASWPHLKLSVETHGMDRAARQQRLSIATREGQAWVVDRLLQEDPTLPHGHIGLACRLFLRDEVARILRADPTAATRAAPVAPPLIQLAQSRMLPHLPGREADMLAIAGMLHAAGADVNASVPVDAANDHPLSTLYFAIGHAGNMPLARWLLDHGADPNDGESLYHATELGHRDGLRLLLEHGADPRGTNALLRAMDFHDLEAVEMLLAAGALADEFDGTPVGGEAPIVVPALHQAARRMCSAQMATRLLDAGADPLRVHAGVTPYSMARVFGNRALVALLRDRGAETPLSREEALLARAADGEASPGAYIDPARLPDAYRDLVRLLIHLPLPDITGHLDRLVALGVPHDTPDAAGLTPVQIAGWEGLPEVMAHLLRLRPDLSHINGYGGTLLSTIMHGSENNPARDRRDHIACLDLALREGVALPRRAPDVAGVAEVAAFLRDWAERYPGQVVDGGPA